MTINRAIAPQAYSIDVVDFVEPEVFILDNGIKVYSFNAGSQELAKIDFIFDAGSWFQPQRLVAGLTNAFLGQGSEKYSAQQIAETVDSHGAYLQYSADQHFGTVDVLCLNKHLETILEVASDVIKHPIFAPKEVDAMTTKRRQRFVIENNKVKVLSQKKFSQALFGNSHPYSNSNIESDFDKLNRQLYVDFHKTHYTSDCCKIIVAGKFGNELIDCLNKYFGDNTWAATKQITKPVFEIMPQTNKTIYEERKDSLQTSIRMGKLLPNRDNPDYFGLYILTTVLGGYFGSRLMTNIREDKGYTYGIGANIIAFPQAAYLSISSEVGKDVYKAAVSEIYIEMERLCKEPIPESELESVRNYLLGEHIRSFDGVFSMACSFRPLLDNNLDKTFYQKYIQTLKTITPADIQQLAIKYLNALSIYEVAIG